MGFKIGDRVQYTSRIWSGDGDKGRSVVEAGVIVPVDEDIPEGCHAVSDPDEVDSDTFCGSVLGEADLRPVEPGSVLDVEMDVANVLRKSSKPLTLEQVAKQANLSEYTAALALTALRRQGRAKIKASGVHVRYVFA